MSLFASGISLVSSLTNDEPPRMNRAQKIHRENERSNLLTISRLVLRSFLEQSMTSSNRILEGDTQQLSDLLMMLEKILWHGFKTSAQKSLLSLRSPDADLWSCLGRISREDEAMSESYKCVEQLQNLTTSISKIRAFLRLAMMQKKLYEFFHVFTASEVVREQYEAWSLLRQEDVIQLTGALLGLSVVDCNLMLEHDHLQEQPQSVDLSQYIRIPTISLDSEGREISKDEENSDSERKMLLDQNNFLEERNRFLQTKLEETKKRVLDLEEPQRNHGAEQEMSLKRLTEIEVVDKECAEEWKGKEKLWEEERKRLTGTIVEREDALHLCKQQLDDVRRVNADLYEKLKMNEADMRRMEHDFLKLKQHQQMEKDSLLQTISTLQNSCDETVANQTQQELLHSELQKKSDEYSQVLADLGAKQVELKGVRDEMERTRHENEIMSRDLKDLPFLKKELGDLKERFDVTFRKATEYEKALEEMGGHLSESKLRMVELKEELLPFSDAHWEKDSEVKECHGCQSAFTVSRRKHHCRMCGSIFCHPCSEARVKLPSNAKPARVCDNCFQLLKARVQGGTA